MNAKLANSPIWDNVAIPQQPALQEDIDADVCVIGLGGSGLAAIDELLSLNQGVVGLDAGRIAAEGAGRNGGLFLGGLSKFYNDTVSLLGRERAREIYQRTLDEMDQVKNHTTNCVRGTGSLRIAADRLELGDCRSHFSALRQDRFFVENYDGDEGRGIFIPTDAVFHPRELCRQYVQRILGGGAALFEKTAALKIEPGKVHTEHGTVHCQKIIAAIDGRIELLFPELAQEVATTRLQMLATEPEKKMYFPRPVYKRNGYDYLQQLQDGRIAMGGCRDFHKQDEQTTNGDYTDAVQNSIEEQLRLMGVTAPVTHRWAATGGYTKNGLPIAREMMDGVFAVGAYSGTGNLTGRVLGRAVAREVVTGEKDVRELFTTI